MFATVIPYTICERKKRAAEGLAYNGLVQSWPEINRFAREVEQQPVPSSFLDSDEPRFRGK